MRPLLTTALLTLGGCSLLVSFEADKQFCSEDQECDAGYSCLGLEECVADGSLLADHSCDEPKQCADGLVCARAPFSCRPTCANVFGDNDDCGEDAVCVPTPLVGGGISGVCEPLDDGCTGGTDTCGLSPGNRQLECVALDNTIERCLIPCTYSCTTTCEHACGTDGPDAPLNCQPVVENSLGVCLPEGIVSHRGECDLVGRLCAAGFVCVKGPGATVGKCLKTCGTADDCTLFGDDEGNPTTCGVLGATSFVSVCGGL